MKRFAFPLARLERLREVRRTQARAGLAAAVAELRGWREREASELEQLVRPTPFDEPAADRADVDAAALKADEAWRAGRRTVVRDARLQESRAADEVRQHQALYAGAARNHRVVERLREKRFERWRLEAERDERIFLDEVHLLRLLRKRRDASASREETER